MSSDQLLYSCGVLLTYPVPCIVDVSWEERHSTAFHLPRLHVVANSMATADLSNHGNHGHRKRATASVLKTLIGTRNHKRDPPAGDTLASPIRDENQDSRPYPNPTKRLSFLSADYPHAKQRPLGELVQNQLGDPTKLAKDMVSRYEHHDAAGFQGPHGEDLVIASGGKDRGRKVLSRDDSSVGAKKEHKPKKSKSQTSLVALLRRPKSSRGLRQEVLEREAQEDRPSAVTPSSAAPPPIYAQFTSQPVEEDLQSKKVPLNDSQIDKEIQQYTPMDYSPSKQRNFNDYQQPTLRRPATLQKSRPKSEYLTSSTTTEAFKNVLPGVRSSNNESSRPPSSSRNSTEQKPRPNSVWGGPQVADQGSTRTVPSDDVFTQKLGDQHEQLTVAKRGTRVMAAVATFNQIAKEAQEGMIPDRKAIDSSFETLLVSI